MDEYLNLILGDNEGYVALAAKGDTWEEQQFAWPSGEGRVLRWVDRRIDTSNIFICPALRDEKRRVKGDGIHLRWLWADIDWEKVPANKRASVEKWLKKLVPAMVNSGTDDNVHVYLQLSREVTVEEHYRLNQGLRDLLHADAKHPDNSLLRLPGTFNRKGRPVQVSWRTTESAVWKPEDLLRIPAIRDTVVTDKVAAGDGTYEQVDVSHLPGYARRVGRMGVDEAMDRYGTRHGAVYQVTQRLIKLGLTRDEIHTCLEEFAPGLQKEEDENGYDMHRDIDRCIGAHPLLEQVVGDDDDDSVWEEATEEDVKEQEDNDFRQEAEKLVRKWDITDRAKQIKAHRTFLPPPDALTVIFSDRLEIEAQDTQYLIDGLASVGDNISITGQYKTGKTLFVCNLVRALVEGEPFLDHYSVEDLQDCNVGLWSCEMTQGVIEDRYLRPQGFTEDGASRLMIWHGRGYGINVLDEVGKQWAINWLRNQDITVWVIDSFARVCAMAGVEANDNDQVLRLLKTLDEIKKAAGVSELFLIAHTGRSELSKERARGATVFDDWADARWVLTREGDIRFLRVEGRDVDMPLTSLKYNGDTKRLALGTDPKRAKMEGGAQAVVQIVAENPGIYKTALALKIREARIGGFSQPMEISGLINETEELGFIRIEEVKGRGNPKACFVVADEGGTGVQTVDFSRIKDYHDTAGYKRRMEHRKKSSRLRS